MKRTAFLIAFFGVSHLLSAQTLKPYLQSMTDHSVWVGWRTTADTNTVVVWGESPDALDNTVTGTTHIFATNNLWHRAKIEGLKPNASYYYKVKTGLFESLVMRFRTYPAPGSNGHVRVLIVGDTQHPVTATRTFAAAKAKMIEKYGPDLEDHVHLILKQGDNVDAGVLSQYSSMHFDPLAPLSGNIPTMTVVGNHEYYQNNDLSLYFPHFEYDDADIIYNDLTGSNGEHYYAFRVGGAVFCMINSNEWWASQTQWLGDVVAAANADPTVRFLFGTAHHPLRCENWVSDGSAYIRDEIMPALRQSEKTAMYTSGHSHMYARGSSRDSAVWEMISGGGGLIQNWNENPEQDYPDVQRSFDVWTYQIMDLDLLSGTMDVETYSIGNEEYTLDNQLIDVFHRYFGKPSPDQPTLLKPLSDTLTLPYVFAGSSYFSPVGELANSTEFEVAGASGNFKNDLLLNVRRDFENFYQIKSPTYFSPIDQNAGINIFQLTLDSTQVYRGKNWVRVRYRDQNLEWSAWSTPLPFFAQNGREPLPQTPIAWWRFNQTATDTTLHGWNGTLPPAGVTFVADHPVRGTVAAFNNTAGIPIRTGPSASLGLPTVQMTISGWVKVNAADTWGGFIGCLQDNGSYERGWVLGTLNQRFSFALASKSTGTMTYLADTANFALGQWYYLTATYNGQSMRLFVNGQLRATSSAQNGDIAYAGLASDWFGIGAYVDDNENYPHNGALDELVLWARALSDTEVADQYTQVSNLAPSVQITAPVANATYVAPANITVSATASDLDGTVGLVEFYNGTQKLFEDTDGPPFTFVWENAPPGVHALTARATDQLGAKSKSVAVEVVVFVNVPPSVRLVSPANGTVFPLLAPITLVADTKDFDGDVVSVQFFSGTDLIGADTDGVPFFFNWTDVPAGTYFLTALATDNNGGETRSDSIKVTVGIPTKTADAPGQAYALIAAPNPTTGIFRLLTDLDLTGASLSIYTTDNQWITRQTIASPVLDLSHLPVGAYWLEVVTQRGARLRGVVVRV